MLNPLQIEAGTYADNKQPLFNMATSYAATPGIAKTLCIIKEKILELECLLLRICTFFLNNKAQVAKVCISKQENQDNHEPEDRSGK